MLRGPSLLVVTLAASLISGVAGAPRLAHAQEDQALQQARKYYERGEEMFAIGRYREALEAYEKAFEAKPLPELLFNIGQCFRNLGNYRSAISNYQEYLDRVPDAKNRTKVERTIAELEAELEAAEIPETRPETAAAPIVSDEPTASRRASPSKGDQESPPLFKRWGFWLGAALVVAAGAGAAFYFAGGGAGIPDSDLGNLDFER